MYASVSQWDLDPSLDTMAARAAFLKDLADVGIRHARETGVVDLIWIDIEPNRLVSVALFEDLADIDEYAQRSRTLLEKHRADKIRFVSREVGEVFEPHLLLAQVQPPLRTRTSDVGSLCAYLARWRMDPSLHPPGALRAWLQDFWANNEDFLKELEVLDRMVIRTAEDELLVVNLYPEGSPGLQRYKEAAERRPHITTGRVTFIDGIEGRAYDMPALLGDWLR